MKKEFTIKSKKDNLPLSILLMVPKNPIGIVQIAHGMCEHKERYRDFMEFLSTNGYITIINDHRGHGKSVKSEDDLGYMYDDTSEYLVEDFYEITKYIKKEYPNLPITLFGHSMGTLIIKNYLKKYSEGIDKVILCGEPSSNKFINIAILINKISTLIYNDHHRCTFVNGLSIGRYNKIIEDPQTDFDWICTNSDVIEEYMNDPLTGYIFTNNAFLSLFRLLKGAYNKKNWNVTNEKLPFFFIAGEEDPVIVNKKEWLKSMDFLKKIGYKNIKYKMYKKARHELLNEYINNTVYNDIIDFIEK